MSIITGTHRGRLYLYGLTERKTLQARGEYHEDACVVGLEWLDSSSATSLHLNKRGDLLISNLFDELKTTGDRVLEGSAVALQKFDSSAIVGSREGRLRLVSLKYEQEDEVHLISDQKDLFLDRPTPNLKNLKLDGSSLLRLAALCDDRPPVVGSA